jgi:hypothetical protein
MYIVKGISNKRYLLQSATGLFADIFACAGGLKPPEGVAYGIDIYARWGLFSPRHTLRDPPNPEPLGRYARMRRAYLREHRPIIYNRLLLGEELFSHLREIDEAADARLRTITDREQAHEVILAELVYN